MFSGRLTSGVKKQLLELMFLPPTPSDGGARPRRSGSGSAAPAGPAPAGWSRGRHRGEGAAVGGSPACGGLFSPSPFSPSLAGAGTALHGRRGLVPAAHRCPEPGPRSPPTSSGRPVTPAPGWPPVPGGRPPRRAARCPRSVLLKPPAVPQRGPRTARRPLWP